MIHKTISDQHNLHTDSKMRCDDDVDDEDGEEEE